MKLTWFGGTGIRLHIGGRILVADADTAPASVDPLELASGADQIFALAVDDGSLPVIDLLQWRPRPAPRLIDDATSPPAVELCRIADAAVLVAAPSEPPVALVAGSGTAFGRWADGAILVLFGDAETVISVGTAALAASRPRLIALAVDPLALDAVVLGLRHALDGTALIALEPGLALEAG